MPTTRFANVTDDGLLFSNISATETSSGTVDSVIADASFAPRAINNPPVGAPVTGLNWNGFVGGASGPGSSLSLVLEYDISATDPLRGITSIRQNSFTPDTLIPAGATLLLRQEIFSGGVLVGSSLLTRTYTAADTQDPPFEAGDIVLGGAYATLHVRITVEVSIAPTAEPGTSTSFSIMSQSYNSALLPAAGLGDYVFEDVNRNGIQDAGDTAIAGVTVQLLDANGVQVASTTTNNVGYYEFTGLAPGAYSVRFVTPAGYVPTLANQGADDSRDSDAVGGTTQQVTLTSGEFNGTLDAGFFRPAGLGDYVFEDVNRNGIQDAGDLAIAGVTVKLLDASGTVVGTTTTNGVGYYDFTGLVPGDYRVQFVTPAGYTPTLANQGADDARDSDAVGGLTQVVTLASGQFNGTLDAGFFRPRAGLDLEKTTNGPSNTNTTAPDWDNEDTANGAGVPILVAGSAVTWTYKVTNTGETSFSRADIAITDDNGTPTVATDDMSVANGKIVFDRVAVGNSNNVLEAGEVWLYKATGVVQNLTVPGTSATFDFSGNSALDGTDGNVRSYSAGGIGVKASAWSRDHAGGWSNAWLGSYGGGLGVTDRNEGNGSGNSHTVDNVGNDNYVMFRFDQSVVLDKAYLGYVVGDSDMSVWIGNVGNAFNGTVNLNDGVLAGLGFTEVNDTTLTTARWADVNAGNVAGNVVVIAASTADCSPDDYFKVDQLLVRTAPTVGTYENKAVLTAPGGITDSDLSHYTNPDIWHPW